MTQARICLCMPSFFCFFLMRVGWDFRNRNSLVKVASSVSLTLETGRLWCGFHSTTTKYAKCRGDVIVFCAQKNATFVNLPFPIDFTHTLVSLNSVKAFSELGLGRGDFQGLLDGKPLTKFKSLRSAWNTAWPSAKSFVMRTWLSQRGKSKIYQDTDPTCWSSHMHMFLSCPASLAELSWLLSCTRICTVLLFFFYSKTQACFCILLL